MRQIALKILLGDRAKYLGLIFGITFATLLMSQQVSIFTGIMERAAGQIRDIRQADIWVMHPQVRYIEEIKPMPGKMLYRVRGVAGVEWALPLMKSIGAARVDGQQLQNVIIIGVDDATLTGAPRSMTLGVWESLRQPDAVIVDRAGFEFIWPGEAYRIGDTFEVNDQRVKITGVTDAMPPFISYPILFTRYSNALRLSPGERNRLSFILVKTTPGADAEAVAAKITQQTGLQALTDEQFAWRSIEHVLTRTGIPINFGITVLLGFVVGAVVAGQTFYIFVLENLRQFGALKAIGVTNSQLFKMVMLQASVVAFLGYAIGIGLTALFFYSTKDVTALRGFGLPWQVMVLSAVAVIIIMVLASLASLRRVFTLDPAVVFR